MKLRKIKARSLADAKWRADNPYKTVRLNGKYVQWFRKNYTPKKKKRLLILLDNLAREFTVRQTLGNSFDLDLEVFNC